MSTTPLEDFEAAALASLPEAIDKGSDRDTRPEKPCCKRIRSANGSSSWCGLPEGHRDQGMPDCHGLNQAESPLPMNSYAKGKR